MDTLQTIAESIQATDSDIEAIQRIAPGLKAEDVEVFKAKFISDKPTMNGFIWGPQWQAEAIKRSLFIGKPITVEHDLNQDAIVGRIYQAEQKGNAIHGRFFVPTTQKETIQKIKSGLYKDVSMQASGLVTPSANGLGLVSPVEGMDVLEVSFTGKPSCRDNCSISESIQSPKDDGEVTTIMESFGREALKDLQGEFVRYAAWTISESICPDRWRAIAEKLDPNLLKQAVSDLKVGYANKEKESATQNPNGEGGAFIEEINQLIENKGV